MNVISILRPVIGRMPLYAKLLYMLYRDPEIPRRRKACLSLALLYTVSPIDLVPGIIPVIGQLDDIVIALSALLRELKRLPSSKRDDYLEKVHLRSETIEKDLDAAKTLIVYVATRPASLLGRGASWVGDKAFTLAAKGYLKIRDRKLNRRK